jgi:hypothetical protein
LSHDQPLSDDLLTGAKAIAAYIGWPLRQTFFAIEQGHIPTSKVGAKIIARKSELRARFSASWLASRPVKKTETRP